MRKKESWMYVGAKVKALGKNGVITDMQQNSINGVDYVYNIYVKLLSHKFDAPYHPSDVQQSTESTVTNH